MRLACKRRPCASHSEPRLLTMAVGLAGYRHCHAACEARSRDRRKPDDRDDHVRGQSQSLRLYGTRGKPPVIVSSGDGGWIHLGPHVAEVLAARGFFVVGFDVKAYLESFTSGRPRCAPRTSRATTRCSSTSRRAGRRRSRFSSACRRAPACRCWRRPIRGRRRRSPA